MSETKTCSGSCHDGKARFEVTAEIARASARNCSICRRAGWSMGSGLHEDALDLQQFDGKSYG